MKKKMAKNRYIDTRFWHDTFIREKLNPLDRYLFLYFLTNDKTSICGIYELPISIMTSETGIEIDMLKKMLKRVKGKIDYIDGWVCIKNFVRYQNNNSPKIKAGIAYELSKVPKDLIKYINYSNSEPVEKKYRNRVSKSLREKILNRDGNKCQKCGSKNLLEIDHIKPVSIGGTNKENNLRILCQTCNGKRNSELQWDKEGWRMDTVSHLNYNYNSNSNTDKTQQTNNSLSLEEEKEWIDVDFKSPLNKRCKHERGMWVVIDRRNKKHFYDNKKFYKYSK